VQLVLSPCPSGKAFSVGLLASAVSYLLQSQAWRPAGGGKLRLAAQVRMIRPRNGGKSAKIRELGPSFDTPDA